MWTITISEDREHYHSHTEDLKLQFTTTEKESEIYENASK